MTQLTPQTHDEHTLVGYIIIFQCHSGLHKIYINCSPLIQYRLNYSIHPETARLIVAAVTYSKERSDYHEGTHDVYYLLELIVA